MRAPMNGRCTVISFECDKKLSLSAIGRLTKLASRGRS